MKDRGTLYSMGWSMIYNDSVYIIFWGSLDSDPINEWREKHTFLFQKPRDYFLHLSLVNFMSSTALGLLYLFLSRKKEKVCIYANEYVKEGLRTLNILEHFEEVDESSFPEEMVEERRKMEGFVVELRKRWVKILRDFVPQERVMDEIQEIGKFFPELKNECIKFPADMKYAALAYKYLESLPLDPDELEFLVKELLHNAIHHGYEGRPGEVKVCIRSKSPPRISFIDYGKGFRRRKAIEGRGRGLELIEKKFGKIEIKVPEEGKGTEVVVEKR